MVFIGAIMTCWLNYNDVYGWLGMIQRWLWLLGMIYLGVYFSGRFQFYSLA